MVAQVSGKSHATLYRPDTLLVSVEDNLGEASKQLAMSMLTHADGERDVYELVMTALALYDASRHRCLKSDQRPVLQSTLTKRLVLPSFTSEIGRHHCIMRKCNHVQVIAEYVPHLSRCYSNTGPEIQI